MKLLEISKRKLNSRRKNLKRQNKIIIKEIIEAMLLL